MLNFYLILYNINVQSTDEIKVSLYFVETLITTSFEHGDAACQVLICHFQLKIIP